MFSFFSDHLTDLAIYCSLFFTIFAVARAVNATPGLALAISLIPVAVALAFTNPAAHVLLSGWFGFA